MFIAIGKQLKLVNYSWLHV